MCYTSTDNVLTVSAINNESWMYHPKKKLPRSDPTFDNSFYPTSPSQSSKLARHGLESELERTYLSIPYQLHPR